MAGDEGLDGAASPTVLVIDDEDYVADMLAAVLYIEGYKVQVAYNGRDGLAQALALRPQAIIVDIMMPYLSGEDLVLQLQKQLDGRGDPAVLLISAGARPRKIPPSVTFMPKPFDVEQLLEWLHGHLGQPGEVP